MKRRLKNTPSARLLRRATAYARLGAKAHRAGNWAEASTYHDQELRLRRQAERAREVEERRRWDVTDDDEDVR